MGLKIFIKVPIFLRAEWNLVKLQILCYSVNRVNPLSVGRNELKK